MRDRIILHCDANSFYASCEVATRPELLGKPVAVAGNVEKRTGIILTKNHIAKKYGVVTGEAIWQAKQKCPDLVCLLPNFKLYEEFSKRLRKIYEDYTDRVEPFGIDECWLDITTSAKFFGTGEEVANIIRERVKKELGITVSVGVSFCKIFAKLGSDYKKPDAVTVISKENFKDIVYPLPIDSIIGIGRRLTEKYHRINVFKLGEIIKIPDNIIKAKFGKLGLELKQKLLGNDNEDVSLCNYYRLEKSIGNGTTTIKDIKTKDETHSVINALCEEISQRLRHKNFCAKGISVTIKTSDFKYLSKSCALSFATNSAGDLFKGAINLLETFWTYSLPVRAIRICSFNLENASIHQLNMFENVYKKESLNKAIDKIRDKYGYFAIVPASMCKNRLLDSERIGL